MNYKEYCFELFLLYYIIKFGIIVVFRLQNISKQMLFIGSLFHNTYLTFKFI